MAKRTPLSYKEFIDLAQKYYYKGGDSYVECWDEKFFNEFVKEFRPIYKTTALEMFKRNLDEERDEAAARRWYAGEGYEGDEEIAKELQDGNKSVRGTESQNS